MLRLAYLFMLIGMPVFAWANKVTWYAYDQPPAHIFEGKYKQQGYINKAQQLVTERMPTYRHVEVLASVGRIMRDLRSKDICVFGLFKTPERQQYVAFSQPALIHRNLVVMMKKSTASKHQLAQTVSLHYLLGDLQLNVYTIDGRSYGNTIDGILKEHKRRVSTRATKSTRDVYRMLQRDRTDFILVFPESVNYAMEVSGFEFEYELLAIDEVPKLTHSYIGCHDSNQGRQIIKDIDRALTELVQGYDYLDAMATWERGDLNQQGFKEYYQHVFMKGKQ